jgi:hypothetical protein
VASRAHGWTSAAGKRAMRPDCRGRFGFPATTLRRCARPRRGCAAFSRLWRGIAIRNNRKQWGNPDPKINGRSGSGIPASVAGRVSVPALKGWPLRAVLLECGDCGYQTSVTARTIFQDTRKPLALWFRTIWWVTSQKNGASALGLQRALGLGSYKTAWTWRHK